MKRQTIENIINFAIAQTQTHMKKIITIIAFILLGIGAQAQEEIRMYDVKSGIVTMEMDMMGRKVVQDIYFDDYGAKQAMIIEMRGQKMRGIEVDGEMVMINDAENTAVKMPSMGMTNEKINFLDQSPKNIRRNKIKEIGKETLLDRECTIYTVAVFMMGNVVKQTVWVYKGITLKSSITTDWGEMVQTATSLVEDIEIPAETFTLPEGIEIQTMSHGPRGGGGGGYQEF